jgi:cation diffusion facilitator CzcD-associated flavoprotein CzcO
VHKAVLQDDAEVAVIGAGPYGLAAAAHLRSAKISTLVFGRPMSFWREHMPKGMRLRSPWIASHIADPQSAFTLDAFASESEMARRDELPIDHFLNYGDWFARQAVPDLDTRRVLQVERAGRGFRLVLDDDEVVHARRLVVAMGLAGQGHRPAPFAGVSAELVSHTSEQASLDKWRGRRVAVIGRGQSACESAALLNEAGSEVELVCRGEIRWVGATGHKVPAQHHWRRRLRQLLQAPSAVGPFPFDWFNEWPAAQHLIPDGLRSRMAARSLRPASAGWLRPRIEGIRIRAGHRIHAVRPQAHGIVLDFDDGSRAYDHVLLGTGYQVDISRLGIWSPDLATEIACNNGSPILGAGFESSVPGLHFVGATAVQSYGPLMRFIAGSGPAARAVVRAVVGRRKARSLARPVSPSPDHVASAQRLPRL